MYRKKVYREFDTIHGFRHPLGILGGGATIPHVRILAACPMLTKNAIKNSSYHHHCHHYDAQPD